ncbi:MAG: thymidine phosphorylase family protein [Deltaproteobacteria bacterium]|nr:thymidine phosphorylase family protein [Deltaproteobacteria bacterium]
MKKKKLNFKRSPNTLRLVRLGIDTYQEPVVYMKQDCHVCRSEGFSAQSRVLIETSKRSIIATLNVIHDGMLKAGEAGLSEAAWRLLKVRENQLASFSHPKPLDSLSYVRRKAYGHSLSDQAFQEVIHDIVKGRYADVHLAAFITACSGDSLNPREKVSLTQAMVNAGERLEWPDELVMDKHCVGGLPGNRTTPIIVPIIAAFGLKMPKTSSRAITSPAGTADTMAVLTQVSLSLKKIHQVIAREGACMAYGGAMKLSPADDTLIRVERVLDLDSQGQLVASVLSKKIAAGATHVIIDLPMGPTAKVRSLKAAQALSHDLKYVAKHLGLKIKVILTDGRQPVGYGIGPALEARDVLAVLQGKPEAPQDLRERSLDLAGELLELSGKLKKGQGRKTAAALLDNGEAWKKFQAICRAQGGLFEPPIAKYQHSIAANCSGKVIEIDNRLLARVAKLAGAPADMAAGLQLHKKLGDFIQKDESLFTVHAESQGELEYALDYVKSHDDIFQIRRRK